jgi:hypothetical protein
MSAAFSASSTCAKTVASTLTMVLADDTCTAGDSPKKLGSAYKAPTTNAISNDHVFPDRVTIHDRPSDVKTTGWAASSVARII